MSKEAVAVRPASTMLLLRDGAEGMEVFMVVRHHQIDFASGALVFPGGSVDADDHRIAGDPTLYGDSAGLDAAALAFRIGAVRETFEECGILLARTKGSNALVSAARADEVAAAHRAALNKGERSFSEILTTEGMVPALDLLVPFAHWITPVGMPKRFDTHFYLAVAPADQVGAHDGTESVDSIWVSPNAAVEGAKTGKFKLVFATERNLIKLGKQNSAAASLDAARRDRVVTVCPEIIRSETSRQLRIPADAGYDGSLFDMGAG
ncbi:NUDIX hydrolase [Bradyrhizobium sp. LHD-71]|uniref:NUDIX hydrolase n=1 Tax=Bradyrhizobium sp. LHD-71 TaxID=3072141 RepID=UPI0028107490|nr:NUDIX hydrolase [Bradyrhizobium sp. LHD-71]MDQ8726390.1 NUDIX hydrolase [Bradyrhizobium sp. LHD-71]